MIDKFEDFGARVKAIRAQLSLSQEDFAHALGVSFATVNRRENGKNSPSKLARKQFEQFCEEKGIDPAEGGDNP